MVIRTASHLAIIDQRHFTLKLSTLAVVEICRARSTVFTQLFIRIIFLTLLIYIKLLLLFMWRKVRMILLPNYLKFWRCNFLFLLSNIFFHTWQLNRHLWTEDSLLIHRWALVVIDNADINSILR